MNTLPKLHDYQELALDRFADIREQKQGSQGASSLFVAPPGAGKSRVMIEMAEREVARGGRPVIKVHRKMLLEQMITVFQDAGHEVGVLAPDYFTNESAPILLASSQTIFARSVKRSRIELPEATLVINDEAHQQASKMERSIIFGSIKGHMVQEGYLNRGVDVVGFTATPLMNSRIYETMVDFAKYSLLRDRGMHQLVGVYGPDEIDTRGLSQSASGDFSEKKLEPRVEKIFGSVYNEWKKLNPEALPAILFAPSVASSMWFAYEFMKLGVPVAHIDGERCLLPNGAGNLEIYPSTAEVREEVLRRSREGEVKIVMNRFILREAIDMPWLYHGIFATVMGSPTTALQSVGRLQRFWPDYTMKILQDHGGFYWRHGSPNSDRIWRLGGTNKSHIKERVEQLIAGEMREGVRCPKCGFWRYSGAVCLNLDCRHAHTLSVRKIRMLDGTLKRMGGSVYRASPEVINQSEQDHIRAGKIWVANLYRCARTNKTIGQAVKIASDEAAKHGIRIDFNRVKFKPPRSDDVRWHLRIAKVFPWTVAKRKTSGSGS